jgi:hypothetical protein
MSLRFEACRTLYSHSQPRDLLRDASFFSISRRLYIFEQFVAGRHHPALHNRVSRFTANGDVAVAGSEQTILDLNNLTNATNHNGGTRTSNSSTQMTELSLIASGVFSYLNYRDLRHKVAQMSHREKACSGVSRCSARSHFLSFWFLVGPVLKGRQPKREGP